MSVRELDAADFLDVCPALQVRSVLDGFLSGRYIGASILIRSQNGACHLLTVGDMPDIWNNENPI